MKKLKYFVSGEKPTLEEVLDNREKRRVKINKLIEKYDNSSILCFKLNIPGAIKNNDTILEIFNDGKEKIMGELKRENIKISYIEESIKSTGPELFLSVLSPGVLLKKTMIDVEENSRFGRLYDIDVEDKNGTISRKQLGFNERKCFLCDNEAKICARSRNHTIEDMLFWIEEQIEDWKK